MILLLTFTQLLVVTLVITAVLLGSAIGYLFLRARQFERADALSDSERAELQRRDKEILLIRQRIEEIYQGQQRGAQTQHALILQQVEQVQHELKNRSRQIDTLQSQLRHEMQQREVSMNELREQLGEAVRALSTAASARALPAAPTALPQQPESAAEPSSSPASPPSSTPETLDSSWLDEPVEMGFTEAVLLESSAPEAHDEADHAPTFTPLEELFADGFFADATQPNGAAEPAEFTEAEPEDAIEEELENGGVVPLNTLLFGDESENDLPEGFALADFDPDTFEAFEPDADWLSPEPDATPAAEHTEQPSSNVTSPEEVDPLEDLVQWTPISFDGAEDDPMPTGDTFGDAFGDSFSPSFGDKAFEPTPSFDDSFQGDGFQGDGSSRPEPAPPARPQGAEDLTALPSVSEKQERALYDVGLHTVEDIARLSRADARRISRALGGNISEDDIMNVWVFEAQSVLFERYQNELHLRRTQA